MTEPSDTTIFASADPSSSAAFSEFRRRLHDGPVQLLEYLASGGWGQLDNPDQLRAIARDAADELRLVMCEICIDGTLADAVHTMQERAQRLAPDIRIHVHIDDPCYDIPARNIDGALRAMREAVNNAVEHARASTVELEVTRRGGRIHLCVRDDGDGCDWRNVAGFGLRDSIMARMSELGGRAVVSSRQGEGTMIQLTAYEREELRA